MPSDTPSERLKRAEDFIWHNARLIDRQLFAYLFRGGLKEPVLAALRAYQNPDGGFGNALEPDKRCPDSQPVDVEVALHLLDLLDAFESATVEPVCNWLASVSTPEGGVPFALPSVNAYPHAPWWSVPENPPASLNPTAAITGLLLKHQIRHPWVEQATAFCWRAIEDTETTAFHTLMSVITFLEHAPDWERAERELSRVAKRIVSSDAVAIDPLADGYVHPPLAWAPMPKSFCRRLFSDDVILAGLEVAASQQQPDGGWPISWQPVSKAVELEWRSRVTIDTLRTLGSYEEAGLVATQKWR